jgi:hypothetical protein
MVDPFRAFSYDVYFHSVSSPMYRNSGMVILKQDRCSEAVTNSSYYLGDQEIYYLEIFVFLIYLNGRHL